MSQQELISSLPNWVPAEAWAEFLKMRTKIRKPLTEYGQTLALKTLARLSAAGYEPQEVLDYAIENSNQGLFPPRGATPQRQQFQTPTDKARGWADSVTGRTRNSGDVIDIAPARRLR